MLGARADTCKARCTRAPDALHVSVNLESSTHRERADVFTGAAGDIVNAALAAPLGCIVPRWSGLS